MYHIITGMSQNYYDLVGCHMISSWLEHWPKEFVLNVYTEDKLNLSHPRINIISLDTMGVEYHKFQNENLLKLNDRAKIFAKKAWPIMQNLKENTGKLLWLDADVITVGEITKEWLDSLLSKKDFSAHFGVFQSEFYSVETGFFIINRENKFKEDFLNGKPFLILMLIKKII